jgi:hypothetical protein
MRKGKHAGLGWLVAAFIVATILVLLAATFS